MNHAAPVIVLNESERRMTEGDRCRAIRLGQAVLDIRDEGIRRKQRACNFKQRGPLDGLHMTP